MALNQTVVASGQTGCGIVANENLEIHPPNLRGRYYNSRTRSALLSSVDMGIGKKLFLRLLEYYKTINAEGVTLYWNEYDKDDE